MLDVSRTSGRLALGSSDCLGQAAHPRQKVHYPSRGRLIHGLKGSPLGQQDHGYTSGFYDLFTEGFNDSRPFRLNPSESFTVFYTRSILLDWKFLISKRNMTSSLHILFDRGYKFFLASVRLQFKLQSWSFASFSDLIIWVNSPFSISIN